jgi:hypothetical protein
MSKGPHATCTRGGGQRGDPNAARRCGARTRSGTACQQPAMRNGRCRMHGGTSTGPRTPEGLARCTAAPTKHGGRNAQARAQAKLRGEARSQSASLRRLMVLVREAEGGQER